MSFNFHDFTAPLNTRFNTGFKTYMEYVKKHIKFDKNSDSESYPEEDRNGFIHAQTLTRRLSDGTTIQATFYPSLYGRLNIIYSFPPKEKRIERNDVADVFFFSGGTYEGSIDEMKDLFEVHKELAL
jgi:hypothetical protein